MDKTRSRIIDLRAKAIALSELEGVENLRKATELLFECSQLFKQVLPEDGHLSAKDIRGEYAWEAREWALLCESAGIIYAQAGRADEALNAFAQAKRFFVSKEDIDRLEANRQAIEQMLREAGLIT
jgi:tetratricopeptide (TPR) repeat protein